MASSKSSHPTGLAIVLESYLQHLQGIDLGEPRTFRAALPVLGHLLAEVRSLSESKNGYSADYVELLIRHSQLVGELCRRSGPTVNAGAILMMLTDKAEQMRQRVEGK